MTSSTGMGDALATGGNHAQIVKFSVLAACAFSAKMAESMLHAKAVAILVGPAGVGLMGMLTNIMDISRSLGEIGINSGVVRQIAAAQSVTDAVALARIVRRCAG